MGKTTIFMNAKGRLTQFETLVDACHNGGGEKETKPTDLEGFWDGIIVAQVEDIERDFQTLKAMESRGWNEAEPGLIINLNFLCFAFSQLTRVILNDSLCQFVQ